MGGLGDMLIAQTGMFLRRVGPARFERRPTLAQSVKNVVGLRDETLLVPPYRFHRPGKSISPVALKSCVAIRFASGNHLATACGRVSRQVARSYAPCVASSVIRAQREETRESYSP